MPGGRPKTSGKRHNKSSDIFDCWTRPSINTYCPSCYWNVLNYQLFQKTCRESANVDITEEPLTSVPRVEIEDEEDENMNDNTAPVFRRNKVKTTIESTKELIYY